MKHHRSQPQSKRDFDWYSAEYALTMAARQAAEACRVPDGLSASGVVSVTFHGDGTARNVVVLGNHTGGASIERCVTRHFKTVRVAPFSADPVRMTKTFNSAAVAPEPDPT